MNTIKDLIEGLIDYLTDVYDRKKIGGINQDFFIKIKELDKKLEKYFLFFENESELKSDIESYYNRIKHMSFPHEDGDPYYIKHLLFDEDGEPISGNVSYSKEWHNNYSHNIHSHLLQVFKNKLGVQERIGEIMHTHLMQVFKDKPKVRKKREKNRITFKNKKVVDLIERINLELEFLREDCTAEDFINVLIGRSEKDIYLSIDNRNFHYLLTKIKDYFYNFTITAVAKTNKIHSKTGNLFAAKNLRNSKSYSPSLKNEIDEIVMNFR